MGQSSAFAVVLRISGELARWLGILWILGDARRKIWRISHGLRDEMDTAYIVPSTVREAARHGELVVFVGAGVSVLCGSPSWDGFANAVIDQVRQPAHLSFLDCEQLRSISDPRRRLSIALDLAREARHDVNFDSILHPSAGMETGLEAYRLLRSLRPVFVTTNYDRWFDIAPPSTLSTGSNDSSGVTKYKPIYGRDKLAGDLLFDRDSVIHLHGSCLDPGSMVVSLRDYISHYSSPYVQAFLREMFANKTVLFVGYGLAEMEILEYVIRFAKLDGDSAVTSPRHHVLYGYRSSEEVQSGFIERFFQRECNIGVLKYKIDIEGWGELVNVLRSWQSQLDVRDATTMELQQFLDRCIENEQSGTERASAIRLVTGKPQLVPYLLSHLSGSVWFEELRSAGYFDPMHNLTPIVETSVDGQTLYSAPRWPAVGYLEKIAEEATLQDAATILELIVRISDDAKKRTIDNWTTNWTLARTLSKLPTSLITLEHIDVARGWLEGAFSVDVIAVVLGQVLLPRLLEDADSTSAEVALALTSALTLMRKPAGGQGTRAVLDSYHAKQIFDHNASLLGRRCGLDAVTVLIDALRNNDASDLDSAHSHIWRAAIEDHHQDRHRDELRDVLISAVRDAAVAILDENSVSGREVVTSLLDSEYPVIRRIGIYVGGERYETAGELVWPRLTNEWVANSNYWHEIYWFLRKGFPKFRAEERARLVTLLDALRGPTEGGTAHNLARQRDLLSAVVGMNDAELDGRFARLVEVNGRPGEHPDLLVYSIDAGWVGEQSPASPVELLHMSPEVLSTYLRDFEPSNAWNAPSRRGLADALAQAVRQSESGYMDSLADFIEAHPAYQQAVLSGIRGRWVEDKTSVDWVKVLHFAHEIVLSAQFIDGVREDATVFNEPTHHWVAREVADLIQAGISEEERAIPQDLLGPASAILIGIARAYPPTPAEAGADAVSNAINRPRGRALEAIIRLLLHARALHDKGLSASPTWEDLREFFDEELDLSEAGNNADFAAHLGVYLPNMRYLAEDWVERNFDRIFSQESQAAWACAAQGFAYQRTLYDWLYTALKDGGHLARMLARDGLPDTVTDKAIQFVALAYLHGTETLSEARVSLIGELLRGRRVDDYAKLAWFLWTLRGGLDDTQRQRVMVLWLEASRLLSGHEMGSQKQLSHLSLLAVHIGVLTPEIEAAWVQAAPYADVSHHGSTLVAALADVSATNSGASGRVFLAALAGFLPQYDPEDIKTTVANMAVNGEVDLAEQVCMVYANSGSTLLNSTYQDIRQRRGD